MTFFIRVRALRERAGEGERKTRVPMRTGRGRSGEDRDESRSGAGILPTLSTCMQETTGPRCTYLSASFSLILYLTAVVTGQKNSESKDKTYLKLAEVQQPRELEGTPTSKLNSRTKEVEGEGGRHGAEELGKR